uniref:N/A n=1 Tax=Ganoderma boninense TaxID=34458 RepID=A0A5K1JUK1_9APHY|nr:N/A [Ganoderma boninense]
MLTSAIIFSIGGVEGTGDSIIARSHLDLFFAILTGKLYTIGILRTLNSRTLLRERLQSIPLGRQSLSRWEWAQPRENFRQSISLEGAEADEEDDTVGGESEGSRKELQPTPTTVDVTESNVLPTEGAPIVIMQPPPEHLDVIVGNGSGIDHSPSPLRESIPIQRRMSATRDQPSPEPNQAA